VVLDKRVFVDPSGVGEEANRERIGEKTG